MVMNGCGQVGRPLFAKIFAAVQLLCIIVTARKIRKGMFSAPACTTVFKSVTCNK